MIVLLVQGSSGKTEITSTIVKSITVNVVDLNVCWWVQENPMHTDRLWSWTFGFFAITRRINRAGRHLGAPIPLTQILKVGIINEGGKTTG
jgi:hypothetical protein